MEGGAVGHNIERGLPKDHPSQICLNLVSAMIASFINGTEILASATWQLVV
jgi:hypothetical protein